MLRVAVRKFSIQLTLTRTLILTLTLTIAIAITLNGLNPGKSTAGRVSGREIPGKAVPHRKVQGLGLEQRKSFVMKGCTVTFSNLSK